MSKKIQAYFNNESDALNVKDQLLKYDNNVVEIGVTEDTMEDIDQFELPFAIGTINQGIGVTGSLSDLSATTLEEWEQGTTGANYRNFHSVLTAKVKDENYEEVVDLIRRNQGHVY
ncbi:MAG: hypothetical protein JWN30_2445 [Bacilli bacterium]|nr:hypothetical protein [Bacilli bacterium]